MPRVLLDAPTSRYVPAMYRTSSATTNSSSTSSGAAAAASRNAAIDGNDDAVESKTATVSRKNVSLAATIAALSHTAAVASSERMRS